MLNLKRAWSNTIKFNAIISDIKKIIVLFVLFILTNKCLVKKSKGRNGAGRRRTRRRRRRSRARCTGRRRRYYS